MSKLQEEHREQILAAGGIHILAYNLEDVKKSLKNRQLVFTFSSLYDIIKS